MKVLQPYLKFRRYKRKIIKFWTWNFFPDFWIHRWILFFLKILNWKLKLLFGTWNLKFFFRTNTLGGGWRIVEICWEHLRKIGLQQNFSHKILSTLVGGNRLKTLISGIWEHLKKTGQKTGFDGPNPPSTFRYKFCRCWRCLN